MLMTLHQSYDQSQRSVHESNMHNKSSARAVPGRTAGHNSIRVMAIGTSLIKRGNSLMMWTCAMSS